MIFICLPATLTSKVQQNKQLSFKIFISSTYHTMESIKQTVDGLSETFHSMMNNFQKELKDIVQSTGSISALSTQFETFRSFVVLALNNLQSQVKLLSKQQDELEMRSRRKILLLHGVSEMDKEDTAGHVIKLMSEQLKLTQLTSGSFSRCHRLGRSNNDKPRAILIKFKDLHLRNQVWSSKTGFKGSGVTISEFLTKKRHKIFMAARQRFGVTKCWTRDGAILVLDDNGLKHRVTEMSELDAVPGPVSNEPTVPSLSPDVEVSQPSKSSSRTRRVLKK